MGSNLKLPKVWMLVLALSLIWHYSEACNKGCVWCGSDSKCVACDTRERYYKQEDGTCARTEIENCEISGFLRNECVQCAKEMVYDPSSSKCVEVPSNRKTSNCDYYNQSSECVACQLEHYLNGGECFPATLEVEFCLLFSKADFCLVCDSSRRFVEETGRCVDFTPTPSCGIHSHALCNECLDDHALLPKSYYFPAAAGQVSGSDLDFISFINNDISFAGKFRETAPSRCLKMPAGCMRYQFDSVTRLPTGCEQCRANFLLNSETRQCEDMPAPVIENCLTYSSLTSCSKCMPKFWGTGSLCTAHTEVANCSVYNPASDACFECVATHFLTNSSTCTQRTRETITNCLTLSRTLDECETCEANFRRTDDKKGCLTQILNCRADGYQSHTFASTQYLCETCETSYYPATDNRTCLKQSSPNCTAYDANTNSCTSCVNFNFYLEGTSPTVTCTLKTQANCTAFTQDFANQCQTCNNLFSLNGADGSCQVLTDVNCARNTVNTATCAACKPGFILDGSNPCQASTRGYDSLCRETGSIDGKCTKCQFGYSPFQVDRDIKDLPANCVSADPSTDRCTQCAENQDGTPLASGPPVVPPSCSPKAGVDAKCLQLKPNVFEALADNDGNCAKCRDYAVNYLSTNTCTARTVYKTTQCRRLSETADVCLECNSGYSYGALGDTNNTCMPPPTGFQTISGCVSYDFFNNGKCLECQRGYTYTSGTPDTCTAPASPVVVQNLNLQYIDFENNLRIEPGTKGSTGVANCKKSIYVYTGTPGQVCVQCDDGFTAQVASSLFSGELDDYAWTTDLWTFSKQYKITGCVTMTAADYVRYTATEDTSSLAQNCGMAQDVGGVLGFNCIRCKDNFVGTPKSLLFDKSGTAMNSVLGYGQCVAASSLQLQKTFSNQGFRYIEGSTIIFSNQPMYLYDKCTDATKNPVFMMNLNGPNFGLQREGVVGEERPNFQCLNIPVTKVRTNCAVYFLQADSITSPRDYTTADYKCYKCNPGYRLRNDTKEAPFFGQCEVIKECDLTPSDGKTNSLLDACSTCNAGFTWGFTTVVGTKIPNIQSCVDSRRHPDCMVLDTGSNKCLICNAGMTLNPHNNKCENYPEVCATKGTPNMLTATLGSDTGSRDKLNAFLTMKLLDFIKTGNSRCATCGQNTRFFRAKDSTEGARQICKTNAFNDAGYVEGCNIYKGNLQAQCAECRPEFVLNESDSKCVRRVLHSNYRNCDLLKTTTGNFCKVCNQGRVSTTAGLCVADHFCKTFTNTNTGTQCNLCMHGYKPSPTDKWKCVTVDLYDPCIQYDKNSVCQACKDPLQIPIRHHSSGASETRVTCVANPQSRRTLLDRYYFRYKTNTTVNLTGALQTEAVTSGKFATQNWAGNTTGAEYLCLRNYNDCGCSVYTDQFECSVCKPGYYLHTGFRTCFKGTIAGCISYSSVSVCLTCDHNQPEKNQGLTYYKSGNGCQSHTFSNCSATSPTQNSCVTCKKGYYLDGSDCKPNKMATNCLTFVSNQDKCTKCAKGYYLESDLCKAHTLSNCKNYSASSNSCDECEADYYRFQSGGFNKCAKNTASNCKTRSTTENACQECPEGEFFPNGKEGCVAIQPIANCSVTNKATGKCATCSDGFWLGTEFNCNANPTGVKNCSVHSDKTTCSKCSSNYFLSNNSCTLLTGTVQNCAIHSGNSVCMECLPKYIRSENGATCTLASQQSCATYKDTDNCETCDGNNVLKTDANDNTICVVSGISQCSTATLENSAAICQQCNTGFILRAGRCDAPRISIVNCEVYDPEDETCSSCFNGFLLSPNKDMCLNRIGEAGDFCAKGVFVAEDQPVCTKCDFGFYEDSNGDCTQCGGEGCKICDLPSTTNCKVCQSKFFMNSTGTCQPNDPEVSTGVRVLSFVSVTALLLLFFRD